MFFGFVVVVVVAALCRCAFSWPFSLLPLLLPPPPLLLLLFSLSILKVQETCWTSFQIQDTTYCIF